MRLSVPRYNRSFFSFPFPLLSFIEGNYSIVKWVKFIIKSKIIRLKRKEWSKWWSFVRIIARIIIVSINNSVHTKSKIIFWSCHGVCPTLKCYYRFGRDRGDKQNNNSSDSRYEFVSVQFHVDVSTLQNLPTATEKTSKKFLLVYQNIPCGWHFHITTFQVYTCMTSRNCLIFESCWLPTLPLHSSAQMFSKNSRI